MSTVMSTQPANTGPPLQRSRYARLMRVLAVPIVVFWVLVGVLTNVLQPSLEDTTAANAQALVPRDAPSSQGAVVQGKAFHESDYTSDAAVLFVTSGRRLGDQDHRYYDELVARLLGDHAHVQSLMNLWGDPVTRSGAQSSDAQAATMTVRPTGDMGDAESNRSIQAIRDIVAKLPRPNGLTVYVTGPAPLSSDTLNAANESMGTLTLVTVAIITVMLLLAFRSVTRALIPLFGVLITLASARGAVSFLVGHQYIGISSFAMNMLVGLVLGVATDYGIFYLGRYQEARRAGEDTESAYYTAVANTTHVILGSGLAISGATLCLSLTTLNYFRTLGPPTFVAMVVAVTAALTLGPALLTLASKLKWLKKPVKTSRNWRRFGTVLTRWPLAMIAIAALVLPLCIANLLGYKLSYNDRDFAPADAPAVVGYAAADKHFPQSELDVDILYVQADHDMRDSTDMITLDRIAKAVLRVPGIGMIQGVTRPDGRPLQHASLPYAMGSMGTKIGENLVFLRDRVADMDTMAAKMGAVIDSTNRMKDITNQLSVGTHISRQAADELKNVTDAARDNLSNFDDFFRPVRAYFTFERHCFDIPICWALRSIQESIDNVDQAAEQLGYMTKGLAIIDSVTPQLVAQLQATVNNMTTMQSLTLSMQSTMHGLVAQLETMIRPAVDMAQAFDNAKNDDFFFLPPDSFATNDFKVGMHFFMTADGKGARVMIYHNGVAMSPEGIQQVRDASAAAQEAVKGTGLSNVKFYTAGAAANYRDVMDFSQNDVIIMMLATFSLVFLIVLTITRAFVGSILVLIAVILSFAAAMGASTFVWETLLGIRLHWLVLPIAFIVLVGVGCDYNLLFLSRYRQELNAGIKTGLIRAMAGSGSVVITAAIVLAGTMLALLSSDVINIGQSGATIALGLLVDMLVVRLLLVMPLARVLGPAFWWPQKVHRRPDSTSLPRR